jgi:hypothetical protein
MPSMFCEDISKVRSNYMRQFGEPKDTVIECHLL